MSGCAFEDTYRGEPGIRDLMADPIVHAVMRRDGLESADVWRVIAHAAKALHRSARRVSAAD